MFRPRGTKRYPEEVKTMQFLVLAHDGKDPAALDRRMAARAAHIELGDKLYAEGRLLFGSAILDDSGKMIGSMLVADFANREGLDAWLKIEPYVVGKVWETIEVKLCKVGPSFTKSSRIIQRGNTGEPVK